MTYIYSKPKVGRIYGVLGTDPASGSEIAYQVPANKVWKVRSVAFSMWAGTGSATSSRSPHFIVSGSDGTLYYKIYSGHDYKSGSGTTTYHWIAGFPTDVLHTGSSVVAPLPEDMVLDSGQVMGTSTTNIALDDNWTAPVFLVEEYSE